MRYGFFDISQDFITIFCPKKTLKNCMFGLIGSRTQATLRQEKNQNFSFFVNEANEIAGFNFFDIKKSFRRGLISHHFTAGLNYPSLKLVKKISELLNYDLTPLAKKVPFVVCEVISAIPIPNTHLKRCKVNTGSNKSLDVVCGADNVRVGLKTVLVHVGGVLPDGTIIKKAKIAGYDSMGMLCSEKELHLKSKNQGIIEIKSHIKIGKSFLDVYLNNSEKFSAWVSTKKRVTGN